MKGSYESVMVEHDEMRKSEEDKTQVALGLVMKALSRIEKSGFSAPTYFLGVLNSGFTPWLLGAYPELFGAWFCIKVFFIIGKLLQLRFKEKKQYYFLDFCWIVIAFTWLYLILSMAGVFPKEYQQTAFYIVFAVGNGPLAWSVVGLHCSLVFHNIYHAANLFIHITPAFLTFAMVCAEKMSYVKLTPHSLFTSTIRLTNTMRDSLGASPRVRMHL